jgi:hypothetical protein
MTKRIGNSPFTYQEDGLKVTGIANPDGSQAGVITQYNTLADIPAGFSGTAQVGTQLYVGDGVSIVAVGTPQNENPLASWYNNLKVTDTIAFIGDSTTFNTLNSMLPVSGINADRYNAVNIPTTVLMYNRGMGGQTIGGFVGGIGAYNLPVVVAEKHKVHVFCYGINDARTDASIAGQAYGSTAMITKVNTSRAQIATYVAATLAARADTIIIWRVPNAHITIAATTATLLTNGVTAQNCMDYYRLLYRGDKQLGILPLTEIYPNTVMVDILALLYGDTAPLTSHPLIDPDGLHPSLAAAAINLLCLAPLNFSKTEIAEAATNRQLSTAKTRLSGLSTIIPKNVNNYRNTVELASINYDDLLYSGEFTRIIAGGGVSGNNSTYVDLMPRADNYTTYLGTITFDIMFGGPNPSTAYGAVTAPYLALNDIVVINKLDGSRVIFSLQLPPYSNQGYLRYIDSPNGASMLSVATGDTFETFRHNYCNSAAAKYAIKAMRSLNSLPTPFTKFYRLMVKSASGTAITVQQMGGRLAGESDFSLHDMLATDRLCWTGVDNGITGLLLTGATFGVKAANATNTITLTNPNFPTAYANGKQCVLLSNT